MRRYRSCAWPANVTHLVKMVIAVDNLAADVARKRAAVRTSHLVALLFGQEPPTNVSFQGKTTPHAWHTHPHFLDKRYTRAGSEHNHAVHSLHVSPAEKRQTRTFLALRAIPHERTS